MSVRERNAKSALDLCEEAAALLRRAPAAALAAYYIGAAPFVLGFLFFWADMSRGAFAAERCAPGSLGVAFLFLWMIAWRSVFVRGLRSRISVAPTDVGGAPWKLFMIQWTLQPTKFIALPIAALATLPFASVYAFYHHSMTAPAEPARGFAETFKAARRQAAVRHQQNWLLISLFTLLSVVIFLNVMMAMLIAPQLAKSLLGLDSVFTRGGYGALNSTFLAVAGALTYLIVNPFAQAVYALRSFYVESLETGEDLRAQLRRARGAAVLLCMIGVIAPAQAGTRVTQERLNGSIERVIHRAEFTWRLPRAPLPADQTENWFVRSTRSFLAASDRGFTRVKNALSRFLDWLGQKLSPASTPDSNTPQRMARERLRLVYAVLLAAVAALLVYFGLQLARRRRSPKAEVAGTPAIAADVTREDVLADQQPAGEWLELARRLLARGNYRTALRALYLTALAQLASQGLIAIRRGKSNHDYLRELRRKARSRPELTEAFRKCVNLFERTWYGMYDVDAAGVREFEALLRLMGPRAEA